MCPGAQMLVDIQDLSACLMMGIVHLLMWCMRLYNGLR